MYRKKPKNIGQATVEYLFILVLVSLAGVKMVRSMSSFMGDQMGLLGATMSTHLTVGVCRDFCFFSNYVNGSQR